MEIPRTPLSLTLDMYFEGTPLKLEVLKAHQDLLDPHPPVYKSPPPSTINPYMLLWKTGMNMQMVKQTLGELSQRS